MNFLHKLFDFIFDRKRRDIVVSVALALLCLVSYSNSIDNGFMIDDHSLMLQNTEIRNVKFLPRSFITEEFTQGESARHVYYRPVPHFLIMSNYLLFRNNPIGYHCINLILFFIACLILYRLLNVISSCWRVSFLTSAVFAVHPINGMLVNYNTATGYSVLVGVMALGLLTFLAATEQKNPKFLYAASLICFGIALLCHETALAFPFYLAAALYFVRNKSLKETFVLCVPSFLILLCYMLFRLKYASLKAGIIDKIPSFDMTLGAYFATFGKLILWYISKLLFLQDIVLIWTTPTVQDHILFWNTGFLLVAAALFYLTVRVLKRGLVSLGIAWFVIGFIPVSLACLFHPDVGFMIEPHWLFFASIGFFLTVVSVVLRLNPLTKNRAMVFVILAVLPVLIFSSRQYNDLWGDEKKYCRYWLEVVPGFKSVIFYLASAHIRDGEYDEAKKYYQQAIAGDRNDWQIYTNLGLIEKELGNTGAAMGYFKSALALNPNATIYNNLAIMAKDNNQAGRAKELLKQAIELDYYLLEPRLNLAGIYAAEGNIEAALELCEKNLTIDPQDIRSMHLLVEFYFMANNKQKAVSAGRKLLQHSRDAVQLTNLGSLFAKNNVTDVAFLFYTKALGIDPANTNAHVELGKLYGNLGNFNRAIEIWEEGQKISPNDIRFKQLIVQARQLHVPGLSVKEP